MEGNIDNTTNNLIIGFAVLILKWLASIAPNPSVENIINYLQIASLTLLIIINFKKAWRTIFKNKEK